MPLDIFETSKLSRRLLHAANGVEYIPCLYFEIDSRRFCPRSCPAYGSDDCTAFMLRDISNILCPPLSD